ncbi:hypothetical protein [Salirhabdus salicampi]|uniref:hypothetical protein n=1 Tax=Salirhabdus salicampi TaxID=476102 RepID=UPI0020C46B7F|nr:hypothetical protein [Salirhabdus salicampi]MCP8615240.1 hypothetical protein [Salirhabdus salicampi]
MDKNDLLQFNHSNIQELIRFIDQKAGALLVIYGFLFTATIEYAKKLSFINPFNLNNGFITTLSIVELVTGLLLIYLLIYQIYIVLFRIIKPRHASNYTQEELSIIYFDHISKQNKFEYINHIEQLPEDNLKTFIQRELATQIHEISSIMSQKSKNLNSLLNYLFFSIFLLLFFIFISNFI